MFTFTAWFWVGQAIVSVVALGAILWAFNNDKIMDWLISRVVDVEIMYETRKEMRKPDDFYSGDEDL